MVDKGFKINCGYERTIEQAKEKARKAGGNILKITRLIEPGFSSSCYNLHADVYYIADLAKLERPVNAVAEELKKLLPPDAPYALLYFYRPSSYVGAIIAYNIHLNDSMVGRIYNGSKFAVKVYNEGAANIWTRTEARRELHPNIKFGKAYFIRCGVKMGVLVGQPDMNIVDPEQGLEEYNSVVDKGGHKADSTGNY